MGGPYGLDYGVLDGVFQKLRIPRSQWPDVFDSIRVMEDAALQTMHAAKKGS